LDLIAIRQKYNETVPEYLKRFRETINRCYNLTIGKKDLADLIFAGLSLYLREKMEGLDFVDINYVFQQAVVHMYWLNPTSRSPSMYIVMHLAWVLEVY
jgi:hypothetical protein